MGRANAIQPAVNAGEFSPRMAARVDIDKYRIAVERLENFILQPHGGATRRPGLRFIAKAKGGKTRLVPFVFSNVQAYMLEFGAGYIRFFMGQGQIASGGSPYEIESPYTTSDLAKLQFAQSADVLYIACPSRPHMKLTRLAHDNWTFSEVEWIGGPYLNENTDGVTYLSASATSGSGVTVSAERMYDFKTIGTWNDSLSSPVSFLDDVSRSCAVFIFTAERGILSDATIKVTSVGGVVAATAYLFSSDGSAAVGAALATSDTVDLSATGEKAFTFASKPRLTAGAKYAIVFYTETPDPLLAVDSVSDSADFVSGTSSTPTGVLAPTVGDFRVGVKYQKTDSTSLFKSGHAGSLWRVRHSGRSTKAEISGDGDSTDEIKILGKFVVDLTPDPSSGSGAGWMGKVTLQKSFNRVVWYDVASLHYSTKQEFEETLPDVWYRATCKTGDHHKGSCDVTLYQDECWGAFKITEVVDDKTVTADVKEDIGSTDPTAIWCEGAWSTVRGFPTAIMFDSDRLIFAGTDHQPYTMWGSRTSDYENHLPGDTDDAPYVFTLSKLNNRICWLQSDDVPIVGTIGEEARLIVSKQAPMSGNNPPEVKIQSHKGSAQNMTPVAVGTGIVFLDRSRRKLLELAYDLSADKMVPQDLALFAEHVTVGGINQIAYQQSPDSIAWLSTLDGGLIGLTYYRSENVIGWHRHPVSGFVESIACKPSTVGDEAGRDELWLVMKRVVNGDTVRYIECMADNENASSAYHSASMARHDAQRAGVGTESAEAAMLSEQKEFIHLDSMLTYRGDPATIITGLDHLEGETVSILADGMVVADRMVSDGSITLDTPASLVHVGLPYTSLLMTLPIEAGAQGGTAQGRTKKIPEVIVRMFNSLGGKYYAIPTDVREIPTWEPDVQLLDLPPMLATGDIQITWSGEWERSGRVAILQDQPLPMSILGLFQTVVVNE